MRSGRRQAKARRGDLQTAQAWQNGIIRIQGPGGWRGVNDYDGADTFPAGRNDLVPARNPRRGKEAGRENASGTEERAADVGCRADGSSKPRT